MNIYEFAINFEAENRKFYEECAEESDNESLRGVFLELAEEEKKHENIVRQLMEEKKVDEVESGILPKAKDAFEAISKDVTGAEGSIFTQQQVDVYTKAKQMEVDSFKFYTEKAAETDLPAVEKTFKRLAEEEKKHERIIDNIIEMVNRPNTWLEDAEWYHLEDY
ncbi:MAG: ferritin family protein [Halanaerobiales bacterium]|nr:ferritin family protein [Halanaerobiales bacterium]